MQWVLLATSLLCRAWKALGVVLLGMAVDGAGLTELSAAEPSLQNKQKKKMFLGDKLHVAMQDSSVSTLLEHTEQGGDEIKKKTNPKQEKLPCVHHSS